MSSLNFKREKTLKSTVENYKDFLEFISDTINSCSPLGQKIRVFWDDSKKEKFTRNLREIKNPKTELVRRQTLMNNQTQLMLDVHRLSFGKIFKIFPP